MFAYLTMYWMSVFAQHESKYLNIARKTGDCIETITNDNKANCNVTQEFILNEYSVECSIRHVSESLESVRMYFAARSYTLCHKR